MVDMLDVVFIEGAYDTGLEVFIPMTDTVWFDVVDELDVVGTVDVMFIEGIYDTGLEVPIPITDTVW